MSSPFYFSSHFSGKVFKEVNIHMYRKTVLSKMVLLKLKREQRFRKFSSLYTDFEPLMRQIPYTYGI
ncbi:hypothetical protein CX649_07035 [Bacillaceae bacterium ZC4]|nr:hypothetical protein CX649_07035 [Bacillaceae bacterium ZC4]